MADNLGGEPLKQVKEAPPLGLQCPDCPNVGYTVRQTDDDGGCEQEQCEFCCTEPLSVFNIQNTIDATVEALRAELAEKEKEIDQVSNLAGEWELRYDDMCREAAALRANQATVVQDVWQKAIEIAKANSQDFDTQLSILQLYALKAARHTEDKTLSVAGEEVGHTAHDSKS